VRARRRSSPSEVAAKTHREAESATFPEKKIAQRGEGCGRILRSRVESIGPDVLQSASRMIAEGPGSSARPRDISIN